MAPGETRRAQFDVSVDGGATIKEYGLDSEIRYRDVLDNSVISDTIKARVDIVPRSGLVGYSLVIVAAIALGIIGAGYLVYRKRGQKNGG
jgi:hypothetical protein